MPLLTDLISHLDDRPELTGQQASLPISHITCDSRQVRAGALFVALKGEKTDGADYISQAKLSGATAIVCGKDVQVAPNGVAILKVESPRRALAQMAAAFYRGQPEHMVAITGTDGKTSTADFFRQFMHLLGESSASIGTLGVLNGASEALFPGSHTTPDPVALHKLLADLSTRGVHYAAIEASSHGLHQHRLDGVKLQAAAFTNIARDHLDYHHTDDAYFAAKALLFSSLLPAGATAILNADDKRYPELTRVCTNRGHKIASFGRSGKEFKIVHAKPLPHGQKMTLEIHGMRVHMEISLVGAFQMMNILAALGLVEAVGGDIQKALALIPKLKGVPGRLEQVAQLKNGAAIFVDYAHTPMALASILHTLRPHTDSKLHAVFGCGGDRDTGKRPEMGAVASELADVAIVTDDNPRSEDPASIRAAIMKACVGGKEVADRRQAIYVAIQDLGPGDILVIAGKGHEKTQIIGDKTIPFDDAEVARMAVKETGL